MVNIYSAPAESQANTQPLYMYPVWSSEHSWQVKSSWTGSLDSRGFCLCHNTALRCPHSGRKMTCWRADWIWRPETWPGLRILLALISFCHFLVGWLLGSYNTSLLLPNYEKTTINSSTYTTRLFWELKDMLHTKYFTQCLVHHKY